jgi:predicted ATP-grasp superfamily ATP-dependent carboligase
MQWVPIEINPRLTTSYLGYRQWYGGALGDMLLGIQDTSSSRDEACFHSVDFH